MSPNNPGNFVNDLVEMAKAFEALPKVQEALTNSEHECNRLSQSIQDRELSILSLKDEIAELHSRIRTLEVDRDHAETMFLEADDRTSRALDFIKATFGNAGSLIQALEPVKAEPVKPEAYEAPPWTVHDAVHQAVAETGSEPEGLHTTQPQGQSEVPPEPVAILEPQSTSAPMPNALSQADVGTAPSPASEVAPTHPTPTDASSTESMSHTNASSEPVGSQAPVASTATEPNGFPMPPISPGRYSGKTYSAAKRDEGLAWEWPSEDEWLTNGGTLDNYYA